VENGPNSVAHNIDRRRAVALASMTAIGVALGAGDAPEASAANGARGGKRTDSTKSKDEKKSKGKKVVRKAKKYKGAKYVWGGASPKGFDCSGFTWFVYNKAVRIDLGRTVKGQWKQGRKVRKGKWKPGDIVFFKNTFEKGLSHCGIFIKGQEFIHAENERTGVVISTLDSDYYAKHYKGARRIV
jgi:cell wall-associated NlpC family hydrolase